MPCKEIEDFEVCTFCGEIFKGDKIPEYKSHYEKCRDEYVEPKIDNFDWEHDYY